MAAWIVFEETKTRKLLNTSSGFQQCLKFIKAAYPRVDEDEIELKECECHARGRRQAKKNVVALGIGLHLEELAELEPRIDHAPGSKS